MGTALHLTAEVVFDPDDLVSGDGDANGYGATCSMIVNRPWETVWLRPLRAWRCVILKFLKVTPDLDAD